MVIRSRKQKKRPSKYFQTRRNIKTNRNRFNGTMKYRGGGPLDKLKKFFGKKNKDGPVKIITCLIRIKHFILFDIPKNVIIASVFLPLFSSYIWQIPVWCFDYKPDNTFSGKPFSSHMAYFYITPIFYKWSYNSHRYRKHTDLALTQSTNRIHGDTRAYTTIERQNHSHYEHSDNIHITIEQLLNIHLNMQTETHIHSNREDPPYMFPITILRLKDCPWHNIVETHKKYQSVRH